MADALVSVYIRPDGAYITSSDRTTVGLWVESGDWEFVASDDPALIGAAVTRHLERTPRLVRHPERDEFSTLRADAIKPVLGLAGVRSWKAFISRATLVQVEGGVVVTVTPMRRDGRRLGAFAGLVEVRQVLTDDGVDARGRAVLRAAQVASGHVAE